MATPILGKGTAFAAGEESTYGTEVARTVGGRAASVSIERAATWTPLPHLAGAGTVSANRKDFYQASEEVAGDLKFIGSYSGNALGIFLYHAMGAVSTTGADPYVHTATLATALPTGLTIAIQRGTGLAEEIYGCKVDQLVMEVAAGEAMMVTATIIGRTGGARATASPALTAPGTILPILHHHAGTLSFNAANYTLKRLKITIANKLTRLPELGSLYTAEPARGDFLDVMIEAEINMRDDVLYTAHLAGTQGDVALTFTDSVNTKTLVCTGHNAILESAPAPISSAGVLTQNLKWRCYSDGTDEGLSLVLTNGITTLVLS